MTKPRISTILLVIAFLTAGVAAANFYVAETKEKADHLQTKSELKKVTQLKETLELEKEELTKTKTALEGQVAALTKDAKSRADELAAEKRAREAMTNQLTQKESELKRFREQADQERKEKQGISEELTRTKQSVQSVNNELKTLREAKEALEKRVKEMLAARAKEAEQIVVKPAAGSSPVLSSGSTMAVAPLQGKVLVVNKEFNFVVINLGSRDGIKKGSRFAITRDGKPVVTAEVEKLYDNMSAATLLSEEKKSEVKEGDLARQIS